MCYKTQPVITYDVVLIRVWEDLGLEHQRAGAVDMTGWHQTPYNQIILNTIDFTCD